MQTLPIASLLSRKAALTGDLDHVDAELHALQSQIATTVAKREAIVARLNLIIELMGEAVDDGEAEPEPEPAVRRKGGRPADPEKRERDRDAIASVLRSDPKHQLPPKKIEAALVKAGVEIPYAVIRGVLYDFPDYFEQGAKTEGWSLRPEHRAPPVTDTTAQQGGA